MIESVRSAVVCRNMAKVACGPLTESFHIHPAAVNREMHSVSRKPRGRHCGYRKSFLTPATRTAVLRVHRSLLRSHGCPLRSFRRGVETSGEQEALEFGLSLAQLD
jgi:hypothetical protein